MSKGSTEWRGKRK